LSYSPTLAGVGRISHARWDSALSTDPQPYGEIFVIQIDGTGLRQLTDNRWEHGTPIWFVEQ
jgi:hypothetical protein